MKRDEDPPDSPRALHPVVEARHLPAGALEEDYATRYSRPSARSARASNQSDERPNRPVEGNRPAGERSSAAGGKQGGRRRSRRSGEDSAAPPTRSPRPVVEGMPETDSPSPQEKPARYSRGSVRDLRNIRPRTHHNEFKSRRKKRS